MCIIRIVGTIKSTKMSKQASELESLTFTNLHGNIQPIFFLVWARGTETRTVSCVLKYTGFYVER